MPTSDDYARATIRAGRDLGISVRGIKIGLATNIVEVGYPLKMYANSKVPESLKLPHDAVGSDGYSVGTFQQQIRKGTNGAWWWADCALAWTRTSPRSCSSPGSRPSTTTTRRAPPVRSPRPSRGAHILGDMTRGSPRPRHSMTD